MKIDSKIELEEGNYTLRWDPGVDKDRNEEEKDADIDIKDMGDLKVACLKLRRLNPGGRSIVLNL